MVVSFQVVGLSARPPKPSQSCARMISTLLRGSMAVAPPPHKKVRSKTGEHVIPRRLCHTTHWAMSSLDINQLFGVKGLVAAVTGGTSGLGFMICKVRDSSVLAWREDLVNGLVGFGDEWRQSICHCLTIRAYFGESSRTEWDWTIVIWYCARVSTKTNHWKTNFVCSWTDDYKNCMWRV